MQELVDSGPGNLMDAIPRMGVIGDMEFPGDVEALGGLLCDAGDEGWSVVRL